MTTNPLYSPIDDDTAADLRAALRSLQGLGFSAVGPARFEAEGTVIGDKPINAKPLSVVEAKQAR